MKFILFALLFVACNGSEHFRKDDRCGVGFPAPNGDLLAGCSPKRPFCSKFGFCGHTDEHKESSSTDKDGYHPQIPIHHIPVELRHWREDDRCGIGFPAPNGELYAGCHPRRPYCSHFGFCGDTVEHKITSSTDEHGFHVLFTLQPPPPHVPHQEIPDHHVEVE